MSNPGAQRPPVRPSPSVAYLGGTGLVAVVGLGLAFAEVVPSIVGVIALLPLLVGLQLVGLRRRAERQQKKAQEQHRPGPG